MRCDASSEGIRSLASSKRSLLVVIVPVLSMQTVSTWLMDSTEPDLCRSTPESAMRMAAIMYVRVISRNRAMGTTSRQSTKTSRVWAMLESMKIDLMMVRMNSTAAMAIRNLVTVPVSICSGVLLEVNSLALLSIFDA